MPTKPLDSVLNRDMQKVQAKPIIDIASPVLQEAINYATNVYERCRTSKKGSEEEAFPVIASYLHIIQMADGIEVLISNSCGPPADLLLRSSFEAKLSIEYLLKKKSKKRAIAWLVKYVVDQIEELQKYDPSHQKGKEFRGLLKNDRFYRTVDLPFVPETLETLNGLRTALKKPVYADIYSEYKHLRETNRRAPEWYSLFNGPRNLRGLAQYLNQGAVYETLYRSWSKITHAGDTSHLSLPLEDGTSILGPIRNPLFIVHIGSTALSFLFETTQLLLKEYRTGELNSFRRWYLKEVEPKYGTLVRMEISQIGWYYNKFVKDKFAVKKQEV